MRGINGCVDRRCRHDSRSCAARPGDRRTPTVGRWAVQTTCVAAAGRWQRPRACSAAACRASRSKDAIAVDGPRGVRAPFEAIRVAGSNPCSRGLAPDDAMGLSPFCSAAMWSRGASGPGPDAGSSRHGWRNTHPPSGSDSSQSPRRPRRVDSHVIRHGWRNHLAPPPARLRRRPVPCGKMRWRSSSCPCPHCTRLAGAGGKRCRRSSGRVVRSRFP